MINHDDKIFISGLLRVNRISFYENILRKIKNYRIITHGILNSSIERMKIYKYIKVYNYYQE